VKIKYFKDTDTAFLEFSDATSVETREVSEDVYLDLDARGRIVSMTIEHARTLANMPTLSLEGMDAPVAS
jgi:uncharacterized protein YuzE